MREQQSTNIVEIRKQTLWRYRRLDAHEFILRREIKIPNDHDYFDTMGPVTLFGICRKKSGSFAYQSDGRAVDVPWSDFGIFLPPFSLSRASSVDLDLEVDFLISTSHHNNLPKNAFIFPLSIPHPKAFCDVASALQALQNRFCIDVCTKPTALSSRIKSLLESSFTEPRKLSEIADRLNISQTIMGRYFKRDFGLSPTMYRNQMRIVGASLDLIAGADISDSFQEFGFEDLSQFYKQFKRVTMATPREYQPKKSKITKK